MKLTVLIDNNTNDFSSPFLLGESGVSCLVEQDGKKILWDTGASDVFMQNAKALDIDLEQIDYLAISHGHEDHVWGIEPLIEELGQEKTKKIKLIAHRDAFEIKKYPGEGEIGTRKKAEEIKHFFDVMFTQKPFWITDSLCFLGEIPRSNDFEAKKSVGTIVRPDGEEPDFVLDDTALAYRSPKGLVVITGCAHAGVCNTIAYARQVCREGRILDVVGGFHLLEADEELLLRTGEFLRGCQPVTTHPCHCTDLQAKIALSQYIPVAEVKSGLVLEYE